MNGGRLQGEGLKQKHKYQADTINNSQPDAWGQIYYVTEGRVDIYFTRLEGSKPKERLYYVTSITPGSIYWGISKDILQDGYELFLKCTPDTEVYEADIDKISGKAEIQRELDSLAWQYIQKIAGALQIADLELMHAESALGIYQLMDHFNRIACPAIIAKIEENKQFDLAQLQTQLRQDNEYGQRSLESLARVLQPSRGHEKPVYRIDDHPLIEPCRLVFSYMDISLIMPPQHIINQSHNPVEDIARSSQIRHRRVSLQKCWYQADNGPILGFLQDGSPVALLPVNSAKYKMVNPATHHEEMVSSSVACSLMDFGYVFYKPLPAEKLNAQDIIRFCLQRDFTGDIAVILGIGVLGGLLGILPPIITGILFESIIPEGRSALLLQTVSILAAFALSALLLQMVRSFAALRLESKLDYSLQAAIWDRLLSLPVPFFRQYNAGEMASRAMGISTIRQTLSGIALNTILSSVFSLFNLGLLFFYSSTMAWWAVIITVVNLGVAVIATLVQIRVERQRVQVSNQLSGRILQLIQGISKIRTAGAENRAFFQWSSDFSLQRKLTLQRMNINNFINTFNGIFAIVAAMIIFFTAAHDSNLNLGRFIAFNAAFGSFYSNIIALTGVILAINSISPVFDNIKPILETLPEYDEIKEDPGPLDGSIEVKHVSFRYHKDGPEVLKDVSLKINRGEYIGIVGASGSGKSTLMRVLLGFEKPSTGKVYYGGHDLSNIDLRSVRRQMGVVLQNSKLLSGDVFTNITGAAGLSMDDAWEATRMVGLEQDIKEMPMGMFTMLGEGTSVISGGQRQRMMIARAIIRKPSILMFDEATNSLDNNTQAIVTQSLEQLKATRIVIAHRLSTIINCDRILVMNKGALAEEGNYNQLMQKKGWFYSLAQRQLIQEDNNQM